jgi:hypothetical protein
MYEQHSIWWDIFEVVSKWVALLVAAGFGWLTNKFSSLEVRMDTTERDLQKRTQESATHIAVLQSYHVANTQRLDSIEDTTRRMDAKLDRLIERGR